MFCMHYFLVDQGCIPRSKWFLCKNTGGLVHQLYTYRSLLFLKPIFHQKTGLRWVPDANEISTKNMKCTCPTQRPNARHPTPPIFHWELGLRLLPNAKKSTQKNEMYMADARNWRHLTQNIPTCWYPCVR